jgi:hypothetical protein
MAKKLILVTIHGMGDTRPDYYAELAEKVEGEFGAEVFSTDIELAPVYYQPVLQGNEEEVWLNMNKFPLDKSSLRRFMLYGFGDAGSLEHSFKHEKTTYLGVQDCITDALDDAYTKSGRQPLPVVVIAQSLGCQVLSNYLWDSQHNLGVFAKPSAGVSPDQQSFRKFESCEYLATTGCNIPLFVAGLKKIECFSKPSKNFTWHNFYDKDDVLGWPLSPLSDSYRSMVDLDLDVNAGNIFDSWTAFSHTKYWTDRSVLKHFFRQLALLLRAG